VPQNGLRISEFELRQLKAMRDELNSAFEARTAPVATATITGSETVYPAKAGLDPKEPRGWWRRFANFARMFAFCNAEIQASLASS